MDAMKDKVQAALSILNPDRKPLRPFVRRLSRANQNMARPRSTERKMPRHRQRATNDARTAAMLRKLEVALFASLAIGALAPVAAAPARPPQKAQDPSTVTRVPLFNRTLSFGLPAGFETVTRKNNGTNVLIEYVPRGETVANWTRMVTIQAYRGLGRSAYSTSDIARQAFFPAKCKVGPLYSDLGERKERHDLTRAVIVTGCKSLPPGAYPKALAGAAEQDVILLFRDSETIYTLNYAERRPGLRMKVPSDAEKAAMQIFGAIALTETAER